MSICAPTEKEMQQALVRQLALAKERDEWRVRAENAEAAIEMARRLGMAIEPRSEPVVWAMTNVRAQEAEAKLAEITADNRRLAALNAGLTHQHGALAASQARVAVLKELLEKTTPASAISLNGKVRVDIPVKHAEQARIALAAPPDDTSALRELLIRTCEENDTPDETGGYRRYQDVVDAVLRGES